MKITKEKLKQIIKEELSEMERVPVPRNDPFGPDQTKEIKSHLRALKRIFDEVGLKSVPDEMKRGWSKMRGALERIPGLKEELSVLQEEEAPLEKGKYYDLHMDDRGYPARLEPIEAEELQKTMEYPEKFTYSGYSMGRYLIEVIRVAEKTED